MLLVPSPSPLLYLLAFFSSFLFKLLGVGASAEVFPSLPEPELVLAAAAILNTYPVYELG